MTALSDSNLHLIPRRVHLEPTRTRLPSRRLPGVRVRPRRRPVPVRPRLTPLPRPRRPVHLRPPRPERRAPAQVCELIVVFELCLAHPVRVSFGDGAGLQTFLKRLRRFNIASRPGNSADPLRALAIHRPWTSNWGNGTTFHGSPMNESDGARLGGNTCLYSGETQLSSAETIPFSSSSLSTSRNGNAYLYPVA